MEDLGACLDGGIEKARTAAREAALKAMWDSRNPSPVSCAPIQNVGIGGTVTDLPAEVHDAHPPRGSSGS